MESPKDAADRMHGALFGKNKEETCLDIVINNPLDRRLEIAKVYQETYGKELYEDIKSKLSGHFKELCGYLFLSPNEYNAKMLKRGFKGLSVDEALIFEILCGHTVAEYQEMGEAFKNETGKELPKLVEKSFSGALKKALLLMLETERRINPNPDKAQCEQLADSLIAIHPDKWVDNEEVFRDVFLCCSPEELIMISRFYYKKTGTLLTDVIDKKLSGKNKTFLRELFYILIIPHELFAEKIYLAIKGLGTNNAILNRVLASRCNIDMPEIREIYQTKYGKPMKDDIIGDTSGIYQKLCVYLGEM